MNEESFVNQFSAQDREGNGASGDRNRRVARPPRRPDQGGGGDEPPNKFGNWRRSSRTVLFWVALIVLSVVIIQIYNFGGASQIEITLSEFYAYLDNGNIERATITERTISGEFAEAVADKSDTRGTRSKTYKEFTTKLPPSGESVDKLISRMEEAGVTITVDEEGPNWTAILLNFGPWILILFLFWLFMFRQMQSGPKGIFSFGKSRARLVAEDKQRVTFVDVAGAEEAKTELSEIIDFLKDPGKFQKLGGKIPKGVLLLGPPGTGKTLLARAVAGEAGVPFYSMSGSDFVEMFVGVGASRVRDLFEQGKRNAPCILFIDEIDAVGRQRGAGLGGGHDEREQTLNQLLVEMDGFESNEGVILLAATNRPDVLDPALLRPGRFDRQVVVDSPDVKGREGIFRVHVKNIRIDTKVDLEVLARGTPGLSGADIANLVNEAALLAARRNHDAVLMRDFEDARDKVMMGNERRSLVISEDEKRTTAYHEAGHALVGKLIPEADPIHKVTIIPRGMALGITHFLPLDERHTHSREYLEARLVYTMGGRVAEKLIFNRFTTGAGNDIRQATDIAQKMICEWGMSDKLGPLSFAKRNEEIFLGREIAQHRDYSEETARLIDAEVREMVLKAEGKARELLSKNMDKLKAIAESLLEREILSGDEIDVLMRGGELPEQLPLESEYPEIQKLQESEAKAKKAAKDNPEGDVLGAPAVARESNRRPV